MDYIIREERLTAEEYIDFLKRTDLGSQYPKERFEERIGILVRKAAISLTARGADNELLGVVRACTGRGIGKALVRRALAIAGGEKNIIMYTCANENAVPFYEKIGMTRPHDMMVYDHAEWTPFTVE